VGELHDRWWWWWWSGRVEGARREEWLSLLLWVVRWVVGMGGLWGEERSYLGLK